MNVTQFIPLLWLFVLKKKKYDNHHFHNFSVNYIHLVYYQLLLRITEIQLI